jgi:23S rRNA (pseudouridine1915-N3)-methyltransferase
MKVVIAAVGRPRNAALAAAIEHYEQRAARYWPLDVRVVKDEGARASPEEVMQREGERLRARTAGAEIVACDERGTRMSSAEFAAFLQQARVNARDIAFVIGGAFGLDDSVRRGARMQIALAHWTLPHELARLVLAEQLYRAGTIVRGEPYHK